MKVLTALRNYVKFKRAFHAMTLNAMGELYGLKRDKGERMGQFERRILRKAISTPPQIKTRRA